MTLRNPHLSGDAEAGIPLAPLIPRIQPPAKPPAIHMPKQVEPKTQNITQESDVTDDLPDFFVPETTTSTPESERIEFTVPNVDEEDTLYGLDQAQDMKVISLDKGLGSENLEFVTPGAPIEALPATDPVVEEAVDPYSPATLEEEPYVPYMPGAYETQPVVANVPELPYPTVAVEDKSHLAKFKMPSKPSSIAQERAAETKLSNMSSLDLLIETRERGQSALTINSSYILQTIAVGIVPVGMAAYLLVLYFIK